MAASDGPFIIYGVMPNGNLNWFKYDKGWIPSGNGMQIGNGFQVNNLQKTTPGGHDTFYMHRNAGQGTLYQYKYLYNGWQNPGGVTMGKGFKAFYRLLNNGENIFYGWKSNGELRLFEWNGAGWVNGNGVPIGLGFEVFKQLFCDREYIYGLKANGDMFRFQYSNGSWTHPNGEQIGNGFPLSARYFACGIGNIFCLRTQQAYLGELYHFKHISGITWEDWDGVKIGSGWNVYANVWADI